MGRRGPGKRLGKPTEHRRLSMPLFSRQKHDSRTTRRDDFSAGPGIKDYSDTPDEQRVQKGE